MKAETAYLTPTLQGSETLQKEDFYERIAHAVGVVGMRKTVQFHNVAFYTGAIPSGKMTFPERHGHFVSVQSEELTENGVAEVSRCLAVSAFTELLSEEDKRVLTAELNQPQNASIVQSFTKQPMTDELYTASRNYSTPTPVSWLQSFRAN